ncbi:MAG: VIT domain-containing protein [Syntrophobacteraceae bacterium]
MKRSLFLLSRTTFFTLIVTMLLPVVNHSGKGVGIAGAGGALAQGESGDKSLSPYFFVKSDDSTVDQLPLKSTSAVVNISGPIADVTVVQVYRNEGKKPIEAIYVFPASTRASVHGMKMTIGERTITAEVQKREEARQAYEQAKQEGRSASLLEQERPNVFLMNVANILPGDEIKTELRYTELVVPTDKTYEFVYPTVVGPRYSNRPAATAPATEKWSQNPYLHQGESAPYTFEIKARLSAGVPIQEMSCPSHKATIAYQDKSTANLELDPSEHSGGNRDFILRYRLAGDRIESGLLLYEGKDENFFLLTAQPPERVTPDAVPPREYIFIVDVSGSMYGFPLEISKKLANELLNGLRPTDMFNVMTFSGASDLFSERSVPASPDNIRRAVALISQQQGGGGTELLPAMQRALTLPRTESIARTIVIATDGYVTVEPEVFDLIRKHIGNANIFTFGIGTSVNRHLIEGMARVGAGEPFVVTKAEEAPGMAEKFRKYIESPVLTQIKLNFGSFEAYEVEPSGMPDIFAERPAVVFGKWKGKPEGTITISGLSGNKKWEKRIDVAGTKPLADNSALRYLWGRSRVTQLSDYNLLEATDERVREITALGIRYNLLTAYTSFVAIDTQVRRQGEDAVTVKQPLPLPQGVSDNALPGSPPSTRAMSSPSLAYFGSGGSLKAKAGARGGSHLSADAKSGSMQAEAPVQKEVTASPQRTDDIESEPTEEGQQEELVIESLKVEGGLSKETVRQIIERNLPSIRFKCFGERSALGQSAPAQHSRSRLTLEWTIDKNGSVVNVRAASGGGSDKTVLDCAGGQVAKWSFPAPENGRKVHVKVTVTMK